LKRSKESLTKELNEQKQLTKDKKLKIKKICDDIEEVVQSKSTDKKYYESEMQALYEKYNKFMS
jgi:molecular chaperone DnaK (HSP70)